MSDLTVALLDNLAIDVNGILDDHQVRYSRSGGSFWPDATLQQVQCCVLLNTLTKKYSSGEPSKSAKQKALEKFLEANNRCKDWGLQLESEADAELFGNLQKEIYDFWYRFIPEHCPEGEPLGSTYNHFFDCGGVGKGSNRGAKAPDFYSKLFDSPLTATSDTLSFVWERLSSKSPLWALAEKHRHQRYGTTHVAGNSLFFVEKNEDIARCACTEPTINMWFQKGVGELIERRLKSRFDIDLSVQPDRNASLAARGSMDGDLVTIDLASASDSISKEMLAAVLPSEMMAWLNRFRSPSVKLPDGSSTELHMISSMGNGFTFPLETMLFCCVVAAAHVLHGRSFSRCSPEDWGVFGDDIICHVSVHRSVLRLLHMLGFSVNSEKSFVEGPFRESCGSDFFVGHPVRGIYIKNLKTPQDHFVAINALNRWTAYTGVALPSLVGFLLRRIRGPILWVPPDENDDAGVHVPLDMAHGVTHLEHGLVAYKRRIAKAKHAYIDNDGCITVLDEETKLPHRGSRREPITYETNPYGLSLSFIYGAIRGGRSFSSRKGSKERVGTGSNGLITLRQSVTRYATRPRVTPNWGRLDGEKILFSWRCWSGSVRRNINPAG